ncbi:MAG: T9SS type A sorting domain-containing protein [Bacteroidia bacterium]|nr:T9SS type A sorting domain-containing protein [Bacteroidia bacterium]
MNLNLNPALFSRMMRRWLLLAAACLAAAPLSAQHSVARQWNEVLLSAIRRDQARPTIHARNLFHVSAAMYDAWAAYDGTAQPFLLGRVLRGYVCDFDGVPAPADVQAAREEAISYAAWNLIRHRFERSPGWPVTRVVCDSLMNALGYSTSMRSTDYASGDPAALGNFIAAEYIAFGLQDGSNEGDSYRNQYYAPANAPMPIDFPSTAMTDPNRWQPLAFEVYIDQSGQVFPGATPAFLSPEWGNVTPFAMTGAERRAYSRDGDSYWVYHDPGPPPYLDSVSGAGIEDDYKWNFALVAVWSSHLDPEDTTMWDISPGSFGNAPALPETPADLRAFYDLIDGGNPSQGHPVNPHTGQPYPPQWVRRGDYTRILAEFWADGPDSETPPGHWYSILNYVSDHPALVKRYKGQGPVLDGLQWDVKAYLALGGAVHDAAISAWAIKGWYDYVRPMSAIRYMASKGQSSNPNDLSYHPAGIPLIPGKIELIRPGDPLAGLENEFVGKIKLKAWRAHAYIPDPDVFYAGVDWVYADQWWPYQRRTFVTPPFAGYISGHSTFSRAAAELMTRFTGDAYFPGGVGEFNAPKNEFLEFEAGPSQDITLQWATYTDASDQTSLSRIWGGIHPPVDDIPGRFVGREVGIEAFEFADKLFSGQIQPADAASLPLAFPNPVHPQEYLTLVLNGPASDGQIRLYDLQGRLAAQASFEAEPMVVRRLPMQGIAPGLYALQVTGEGWEQMLKVVVQP